MPTALAISPHLDDAVFSAGGTLARMAREGWRVIVATVFTASVAAPRGFALACQLDKGLPADVDYMALRRAEDAAACAAIGAEPLWLPFVEAPHRGYHSAAALFAGLHGEDAIVGAVAPVLAELVRSHAPDAILAPQAIGAHVDHAAVLLALRECHRPLRLWADFPYASRADGRPSPFADAMAGLAEETIALEADDVRAKTAAVAAYASQLGFQFGGAARADEIIVTLGGTERFRHRPA